MQRFGKKLYIFAFFYLAITLFCNSNLSAQLDQSLIPERIILNLTENPASSIAVTWRTNAVVAKPQAQISLAIPTTDLEENAQTFFASAESVRIGNEKIVSQNSLIFTSLKPNTRYVYRVGDGDHWSEWNQFKTASAEFEPFKFVYLGDPQNKIHSMCSRVFRAAFAKAPEARFWSFAGDIVNHGDRDEEWAEFYDALGWIPRIVPMILLPGNHEYVKRIYLGERVGKLTPLWRPQFTLPENGPAEVAETAYLIDYQGARFVMLNGNEALTLQAEWLDRMLANNPQRWTIVSIHQPLYSTAKNRDNPQLQELFGPIFDKYAVDLVLQGHDHSYGRTFKLKNGKRVADNETGTVYVVSVSGPKVYETNPQYQDLMAKIETGRQLFQVIEIDYHKLSYESFTAIGELHDSFTLFK